MVKSKLEGKEVVRRINRYLQECKRSFIYPTNILLSGNALKELKKEFPTRLSGDLYVQGNLSVPILVLENGQVDVGVSLAFTDFRND